MLFQLREDNETFRLYSIKASDHGMPPERSYLTYEQVRVQLAALRTPVQQQSWQEQWQRAFMMATAMLTSGERHQRELIQRKTATGTRNIRVSTRPPPEYVLVTYDPTVINNLRMGGKLSKKEQMQYDELTDLIREILTPIKQRLNLPATNPVPHSYTISDTLIATVNKPCQAFLKRVRTQGMLTEKRLAELQGKLRADFPDEAENLITKITDTKNRGHLAAISLNSKDGQLVVSIVNQRGDLLSMEGWKLLRLINEHGTPLNLGELGRMGSWQPEPLLALNGNRSGELIGVYIADDSTIQIVCRDEKVNAKGTVAKGTPDRAAFILDQDYLVSLYVAIAQLKEDKQRFEQLREEAEAKKAVNVDDLFDPGLFHISKTGGNQ